MWYKVDDIVVEDVFYLTCIKKMGEITQIQKMKRVKNLWVSASSWFTEQGDYVYYTATHYKEV